ncbi:hypothetical protein FACS189451_11720 [Bacteroidia bacterium]|nr:hypothetical protein FACS189451_11720 [Bacteroidia bacterium]
MTVTYTVTDWFVKCVNANLDETFGSDYYYMEALLRFKKL